MKPTLLRDLNAGERETVARALEATIPHLLERYDAVEYSLRMGLEPQEVLARIATLRTTGDLPDEPLARRAINNSFNELLNGIGIDEKQCQRSLGVGRRAAEALFRRWRMATYGHD